MNKEIIQINITGVKKECDHGPIKSHEQGKRHYCKSQWEGSIQEEDNRNGFY